MTNKSCLIGITMGDPAGIGPEIILKCFTKDNIKDKKIIILGDFYVLSHIKKNLEIDKFSLNKITSIDEAEFNENILNVLHLDNIDLKNIEPGKVQSKCGNAAFEYVKKAAELTLNKEIDAIVTAPLNKEALHKAGHFFSGHTEILAHVCNKTNYAMLLHDEKLKVIHVSTHVSLLNAIKNLKKDRVSTVIQLANDSMERLGYQNPKIAVAGINPHAGEGGLFGDEEIREIIPSIQEKVEQGINVVGPVPPDTVFLRALEGEYDIVVAMYHDQGHIPLKILGFHSGVNITVGLPIIRTSVDHGTAFPIAWKGIANENSMENAILLAEKLI